MRALFDTLCSPSWLLFWEITEFFSIVVVIIGCWGEGWAEHHIFSDAFASPTPIKPKKEMWMYRFWLMVVLGLGIEMIAFGFSFVASNREIEGLKAENLAHEKQVEELRASNNLLEAQLRGIDPLNQPLGSFLSAKVELVFSPSPEFRRTWAIDWAAELKVVEKTSPGYMPSIYFKPGPIKISYHDPSELIYSSEFSLPDPYPFILLQSNDRAVIEGQTINEASHAINSISLTITAFSQTNAHVIGGSLELFSGNRSVKKFSIAPGEIKNGQGILTNSD